MENNNCMHKREKLGDDGEIPVRELAIDMQINPCHQR